MTQIGIVGGGRPELEYHPKKRRLVTIAQVGDYCTGVQYCAAVPRSGAAAARAYMHDVAALRLLPAASRE